GTRPSAFVMAWAISVLSLCSSVTVTPEAGNPREASSTWAVTKLMKRVLSGEASQFGLTVVLLLDFLVPGDCLYADAAPQEFPLRCGLRHESGKPGRSVLHIQHLLVPIALACRR